MATALAASKVVKKDGSSLTSLETRVGTELLSLQSSHPGLKDLAKLHINGAREVEVSSDAKAVVLIVPFPLLADFRKLQVTLVSELEKKLLANVIVIANRTMISPTAYSRSKKYSGVRPHSRTLKAVQESLLDDVCYPTEIVGKRTRVRTDGSRLLRVHLNPKDSVAVENKLNAFRAVYKKLTSKDVVFEFP